jgi:hypothetical protein
MDRVRRDQWESLIKGVTEREVDPYTAAENLLASFFHETVGERRGKA